MSSHKIHILLFDRGPIKVQTSWNTTELVPPFKEIDKLLLGIAKWKIT